MSQWSILEYGLSAISGDNAMAHFIFRIVLATILSVPLVAISYSEAPAQQRATCSQARSSCGTQRRAYKKVRI
jgi:hypothetical protein